jgi:hypothetical protein
MFKIGVMYRHYRDYRLALALSSIHTWQWLAMLAVVAQDKNGDAEREAELKSSLHRCLARMRTSYDTPSVEQQCALAQPDALNALEMLSQKRWPELGRYLIRG